MKRRQKRIREKIEKERLKSEGGGAEGVDNDGAVTKVSQLL
jgi:hypothetical protein